MNEPIPVPALGACVGHVPGHEPIAAVVVPDNDSSKGRYEVVLVYCPRRILDGDEPWDAYVRDDPLLHVHAWSPEDAHRQLAKMINEADSPTDGGHG